MLGFEGLEVVCYGDKNEMEVELRKQEVGD
jgi:hypothetical protein